MIVSTTYGPVGQLVTVETWDAGTGRYTRTGTDPVDRALTADELAMVQAHDQSLAVEANRANLSGTDKLAARLARLAAYDADAEVVAALARSNSTAPTTAELNRLLKVMLRREKRLTATVALLVRLLDPALLADVTDTTDN